MSTVPHDPSVDARAYAYRPSQMGSPWDFHLTSDALAWKNGRMSGHVLYRDIRRVRLSFKPVSVQTQRYVMEIWGEGMPRLTAVSCSWKSMFEQVRQDEAYSAFVRELHRRLVAAAAPARYDRGRNPFFYWPGLGLFAAVAFGFAFMILRGLLRGELAGAAFVAAFLALFLWHGVSYFRRNRPGLYRADALPDLLLPKTSATPDRATSA